MLGFYIEKYHGNRVARNQTLEGRGIKLLSPTMWIWYILEFLFLSSRSLAVFLNEVEGKELSIDDKKEDNRRVKSAIKSIARLPFYSIDEGMSLFSNSIELQADKSSAADMASGLEGSVPSPWENGSRVTYGRVRDHYIIDGETTSFEYSVVGKFALHVMGGQVLPD